MLIYRPLFIAYFKFIHYFDYLTQQMVNNYACLCLCVFSCVSPTIRDEFFIISNCPQ
jgi:hypothetical protein